VYDPRSKGAESYIRLAKEIIERQPSVTSDLGPQTSDLAAASEQPLTTEVTEEHRGEGNVEEIAGGAQAPEQTTTEEHSGETNVEEIAGSESMDKTA
jgi:hypothetical protein